MSETLFEAIERHDLDRLSLLLSQGADANAPRMQQAGTPRDERTLGWRPLHVAIDELEDGGSLQALILLLRYGASVNEWTGNEWMKNHAPEDDERGATPLLLALFRGQPEAVRMLLAAGADPNVRSDEGDTPLGLCLEQNDVEMVALLLRCGADKTINEMGAGSIGMRTNALHFAASRLHLPLIRLLLAAGADPALVIDLRTAQECLPPRDTADAQAWDEATALLQTAFRTEFSI
jgi:uncharacterized protein